MDVFCSVCYARFPGEVSVPNHLCKDGRLNGSTCTATALLLDSNDVEDVEDIVAEYLRCHGYDGLFNGDADCACELGDLTPCGEASFRCRPGFRFGCDCGEHDFHIGTASARDYYLAEHGANDSPEWPGREE